MSMGMSLILISHSKFFLVKKDNPSLSLSQHLINIFDGEFNNELSKHGMI